MPLPKPRKGESTKDFISRCISFASDEGMPGDQAVAACYAQARSAGRSVPPPPKKGESDEEFLKRVEEHSQPDELDDRLVNDRFMDPEYAQHESVALGSLDDMEAEIMAIDPPKSYSQTIEEEQEKLRQP